MASGPITSWQLDGETMKTVTDYFLGLQNHCRVIAAMKLKDTSLWKKSYDSILKSGDITLLTKVHLVKVMVSNSHIWMWELDHKESWALKNWYFELWWWRRLLRVSLTARRANQSFLNKVSPEYSLEELMLKLKLQSFGHLMRTDSLEKTLMLRR